MLAARIRPATPADAPALCALETQCFSSDRIKPRQMRYLLTKARALTIVVDTLSGIAGYCCCLTPTGGRPARLYSIAVAHRARGQGAASMLLEHLFAELRRLGYGRLRLEVRAGDAATQRLYRRFGFIELQRLEGYYEDGESALRMEAGLRATGAESAES
jgi:ribosomal-protein-alanine N-acetyltransferase